MLRLPTIGTSVKCFDDAALTRHEPREYRRSVYHRARVTRHGPAGLPATIAFDRYVLRATCYGCAGTFVMRYSSTVPRHVARELMARRASTVSVRSPARAASALCA